MIFFFYLFYNKIHKWKTAIKSSLLQKQIAKLGCISSSVKYVHLVFVHVIVCLMSIMHFLIDNKNKYTKEHNDAQYSLYYKRK